MPTGNGKFPQIAGFKIVVDTTKTAQVQNGATITTPGQRITAITLDDGTKIVENGALVAGAPERQPGHDELHGQQRRQLPVQRAPAGAPRACPTSSRCSTSSRIDLGGAVTAARYPVGGSGRITITP